MVIKYWWIYLRSKKILNAHTTANQMQFVNIHVNRNLKGASNRMNRDHTRPVLPYSKMLWKHSFIRPNEGSQSWIICWKEKLNNQWKLAKTFIEFRTLPTAGWKKEAFHDRYGQNLKQWWCKEITIYFVHLIYFFKLFWKDPLYYFSFITCFVITVSMIMYRIVH